jgi:hypothetical protein
MIRILCVLAFMLCSLAVTPLFVTAGNQPKHP